MRNAITIQRSSSRLFFGLALAVFLAAGGAGAIWYLLGPAPQLRNAARAAAAVFIAACPGLWILITPRLLAAVIRRADACGIKFSGPAALESAAAINYGVFEKTGALTFGRPLITDIVPNPFTAYTEKLLLQIAASAEAGAKDGLGESIVAEARARDLPLLPTARFQSFPDSGIAAVLGGKQIHLGSMQFLRQQAIAVTALKEKAGKLAESGKTVMYLAVEGEFVGLIAAADQVKPQVQEAVAALHRAGVSVAMLTGDDARTAQAIAKSLGIERVLVGVSPDEKAAEVKKLRREHRVVAFAGNGINDAPALAAADVGIVMGWGAGATSRSADIVVASSFPGGVLWATQLARKALGVIRGNLFWVFAYNVIAIPVAAGVFYPFFGWLLSPTLAVAAAAFSSLFVALNSLRLRRIKI